MNNLIDCFTSACHHPEHNTVPVLIVILLAVGLYKYYKLRNNIK